MKTLEQVYERGSDCLDGRDFARIFQFVPEADLSKIGYEMKPEKVGTHVALPFTRENVLKQLEQDVAFGFEKALNRRGISASLMHSTVMMWNWILEEGLEDFGEENYAQYGLPLFKATAEKYGWPNPIGSDTGSEYKYSAEYEREECGA